MYYAQIDQSGVVYAITQTSGGINSDRLIPIQSFDISLLGKRWDGAHFV